MTPLTSARPTHAEEAVARRGRIEALRTEIGLLKIDRDNLIREARAAEVRAWRIRSNTIQFDPLEVVVTPEETVALEEWVHTKGVVKMARSRIRRLKKRLTAELAEERRAARWTTASRRTSNNSMPQGGLIR
jgi:hypothetical protein